MEFEQNKQPAGAGIDDMTRLAASTRQLTISPIHDTIAAEPVATPVSETTMGSIPGETETTLALTPEEQREHTIAKKNHWLALTISVITMAMMGTGVYLAFLAK